MVKNVHIILTDEEHEELQEVKDDKTWRELLMQTINNNKKQKGDNQ